MLQCNHCHRVHVSFDHAKFCCAKEKEEEIKLRIRRKYYDYDDGNNYNGYHDDNGCGCELFCMFLLLFFVWILFLQNVSVQ